MKVTMLLADSAQAVNGKLYILGGGWSITGPDPAVFAIAMKIEVPWEETNRPHKLRLILIDDDGQAVAIEGAPVEISGEFEVGRPSGLPPGMSLDSVLALNMGPMPLERGKRYTWRLTIDEQSRDDWQVSFVVRKGPPQPGRPLG